MNLKCSTFVRFVHPNPAAQRNFFLGGSFADDCKHESKAKNPDFAYLRSE